MLIQYTNIYYTAYLIYLKKKEKCVNRFLFGKLCKFLQKLFANINYIKSDKISLNWLSQVKMFVVHIFYIPIIYYGEYVNANEKFTI